MNLMVALRGLLTKRKSCTLNLEYVAKDCAVLATPLKMCQIEA